MGINQVHAGKGTAKPLAVCQQQKRLLTGIFILLPLKVTPYLNPGIYYTSIAMLLPLFITKKCTT
jgi:uncharacterized membrane protein